MDTHLSVVMPHWPIDGELYDALRRSVASLPGNCEKIVVVNDGTGFARNVNVGLRLATASYVAVTGNDTVVVEGDVYALCVPGTVTSPAVDGKPGRRTNSASRKGGVGHLHRRTQTSRAIRSSPEGSPARPEREAPWSWVSVLRALV